MTRPAFLTLLVGCLVGCAGVLLSDRVFAANVASRRRSLLVVVTAVASLLVLPQFKGAVVGYQWALRMHGFGAANANAREH